VDFPDELLYSAEHLWVRREEDGLVTVGITDFAQDQLGKVIYVDLPEEDDEVSFGEEMGAIESSKSVSDLISPITGVVVEVNQALEDQPDVINQEPYDRGWLAVVRPEDDLSQELMESAAYQESLA